MSKTIKVRVNLTLHGGPGRQRCVPIIFDNGTNEAELWDGAVIDLNVDAWLDFAAQTFTPVTPHTVRRSVSADEL